jgi:5,6-dimethylbenzimidazole synthase
MSANDPNALSPDLRRGLYETVFRRRDMREFRPDPIADSVLARVLVAAHRAGSVGFTQPWDFVIVRDIERRCAVKRVFEQELEGIVEAPLNIIVTCRTGRFGPAVLGKTSIDEVEVFSTCLAVQNLWLAARAEGLGVGWVSILRNEDIRRIFAIPKEILPVAYLCCGYVDAFPPRPQLEIAGWADRISPRDLLHFDSWERSDKQDPVARAIDDPATWREIFPDG